jgi:MFS family permease
MFNRNIYILFISQALGYSSVSFLVLVTGIFAVAIGTPAELTTLPLALCIIGTAVTAIPAALLMQRIGRKQGFVLAYTLAIAGAALGFMAAWQTQFYLLCLCSFLIGCFLAFAHQFRFAAMESVSQPDKAGAAISFLLLGGVIAAFLGPELAQWGKNWFAREFAG